ncbi:MAG TPA: DUF1684 domain-containing protein [Bryobacteraceae bacterium]|jgi:hypothetical protein|nr:DUF1684 domain-containing protein [Bryobacteraceae bacterium]
MMARLLIGLTGAVAMFAASNYASEIAAWRAQRLAELKADGGWLSLTGLFWLHEGTNPFGTDASGEIVLPDGPAHAGAFHLDHGKVSVTLDGATHDVKPNSSDVVKVGRLSMLVIKRSDKVGIRVKDPESEARRGFKGIESFPMAESYRIAAKWVAEPRKIPILNVIGQTEESESPGYAVFQLHGREFTLHPIFEEPGAKELFYIFRDETSGKETYPAGRFFYSDLPKDGHVILDFNKAYNPPCAFTPYATCPLPPPENRLAVRIEAGEKRYGH